MEKEYDDIEDELDKTEEEMEEENEEEEEQEEVPRGKNVKKKKKAVEEEVPVERYTAFYQEAKIGILDTITKEVVVEGLPDLPTATLEALKLNKIDRIEIASGA